MKKFLLSSVLAAVLAGSAFGTSYKYDAVHSNTGFKIKHLSISNVSGSFKDVSAKIEAENGELKALEAVIKVSSVFTDNEGRDNHLQQVDFFDAARYPEMKFVMTGFEKTSENEGKVSGTLTLKNVSKPVVLNYEFGGAAKDHYGNDKIGFSLNGKIKRSDFDFASGTGEMVLSDEIKLLIDVEAVAEK